MRRATPCKQIRELARQLLDYEAVGDNLGKATVPALVLVVEKMRRPLVTLAGIAGFRSLLARALLLAKAQEPRLSTMKIDPDGSLEGFSDIGDQYEVAAPGVMLVAELLGLLVTFIGESLTLTLVRDAWPDLPVPNYAALEKK